ncbi:unnamed protein product [Blepharisma stoltei]|uniref:Sodium/hydrogen exchanger n=1 Tax=Blepharisma stoltei TaxID=1481888 RepID=A0AAU9J4L2_9CILI|nr:unnamed protein product [Blepharisma stoltei]
MKFFILTLALFASAVQVDLSHCPLSCSHNGECHEIYEQEGNLNSTLSMWYECQCYDSFRGQGCEECAENRYGSKCVSCPESAHKVCGGHGVCEAGIKGSGKCLCEDGYTNESNCSEESNFMSTWPHKAQSITLLLSSSVLCVLMVFSLIKLPFHCLPDSVGSISLGLFIGLIYLVYFTDTNLSNGLFFDPQTFFLLIIPPIMFDAGYSSNKEKFFTNIGTILMFAVVGTIISALIFGFAIYACCNFFNLYELSLTESLLFGSLISAVDPVATIAIFEAAKVDTTLHMIVFGESVLNDAISIALFKTFAQFAENEKELELGNIVIQFTYLFVGSISVGVIIGILSALVFKVFKLSDHPTLETAMFFLWSYIPFVLCEALEMSGILGLLFLGMIMAHYTHFSLSEESKITTHQTFRTFAFIAENFCFVYLGLSIPLNTRSILWSVISVSILLLLSSRGVVVFLLSPICNYFRIHKINIKHQILIWLSGMRGAVAFSLALSLPTKNPDVIISTTQYLILFTIVILGLMTYPVLRCLKLRVEDVVITRHGDSIHKDLYDANSPRDSDKAVTILERIEEIDKQYIQPVLRKTTVIEKLVES